MKANLILINPWVYDFAAYDLWAKPLGLLYLAGQLRAMGFQVHLLDCLDIHNPLMRETSFMKEPLRRRHGTGKFWKQHINLGRRINQNFVSIPFEWLLNQVKYKLNDVGIRLICINESYTSKCSFLDGESISQQPIYKGERITRGLYLSSQGRIINSDVNGGYNILKKAVPNAFSMNETVDGIEGVWLHPVRLKQTLVTK